MESIRYADLDRIFLEESVDWAAPEKLTLHEWAEKHFYLSSESSAQSGRWRTIPYQKEILDCFTDPTVTIVSVMKSARVGFTKLLNAAVGYHIAHEPTSIFVVQPTIADAKGYSKEEIEPMFRDCPALSKIFLEEMVEDEVRVHDTNQTILHKKFPGGIISMVGANSGTGFRRISRRIILLDEIDAYPASARGEGDPIRLAINRSEYFPNRKIVMGSTPLLKGASRIEEKFHEGDQRRFHLPCPQCGHFDFLVFTERPDGRGHFMKWPEGKPAEAHFVCSKNGCVIEHSDKREMVASGKWVAEAKFSGHASFHIWAGYSFSPNATWGNIACEFVDANRRGPDSLKVFVNTTLGDTWRERGEAPDWERLYSRRATYQIGTVPIGVRFLTCGVDVQKDRWVYEVVGWGMDKKSWSIDYGVIPGDTANEQDWIHVGELLNRIFPGEGGAQFMIRLLAIDSGYNTQHVYNFVRQQQRNRVIACKGMASQRNLLGTPSAMDVRTTGKRYARGVKLWPVGVSRAKEELYGWLRLPIPANGEESQPGFCHFPEYDAEYFRQLTAEHLVSTRSTRTGLTVYEWHLIPGRENHALDARVYARAASVLVGLDTMVTTKTAPKQVQTPSQRAPKEESRAPEMAPSPRERPPPRAGSKPGFLAGRGKSWL